MAGFPARIRLLQFARPYLDDRSFFWRLHSVLGMMRQVTTGGERIRHQARGSTGSLR